MKKRVISVLIVLVAVLIGGYCWRRFCSPGRYQIVFGNVQHESHHTIKVEDTEEKYTFTNETKTVPVCIKIDTLTGRTWVYSQYYSVGADSSTRLWEKFKEMPIEIK